MKTNMFRLSALTLLICITLGFVSMSATTAPTAQIGKKVSKTLFYSSRWTTLGSNETWGDCGATVIFFVTNSTDEIVLGMHLYANPSLTLDAPGCIITPLTGPSAGTVFRIGAGGIVEATEETPACQ